jgi:hypothetical protein
MDHSRPDERFAYVVLGSAHLMLEQAGIRRNWLTVPWSAHWGEG